MRISDWSSDVCSSDLRVTDQDGRFSAGSTTEATSMTLQPATAYSRSTRLTRLRLRSAKKPSPVSASDPPPMSSLRVAKATGRRPPVQLKILLLQGGGGYVESRGFRPRHGLP